MAEHYLPGPVESRFLQGHWRSEHHRLHQLHSPSRHASRPLSLYEQEGHFHPGRIHQLQYINPGLLELRNAFDTAAAVVQAKTLGNKLMAVTEARTLIEQNYANTQQLQQFGFL